MNDIIFAGKHVLTYNVRRHSHHSWELIYCTGSSGRIVFDDAALDYAEGDVVVIPPDMPHENVSGEGFTNIHLNLDDATFSFRQPQLLHDDLNRSLLHLFADAYYVFSGDPVRRAALTSAYGNLIVRFITVGCSVGPRNPVVEAIEQSILQNYANPNYKLDEVLATMPYCYDYLCRLFRQEVCITPHRYLTNLRLQAAADLLCSGNDCGSMTEVARMCGFRDPLYFSRLFKKKYQASPSAYCALKREEQQRRDGDGMKVIAPEEA